MKEADNSTKQAALTANSFLLKNKENMTSEEIHALRVLIAAADQNPDQQPGPGGATSTAARCAT